MWSRDVFVSLRELVIGCYSIYDTNCKEFSHTAIISQTRSSTSLAQISPTDGPTGQHEATDVDMRLVGDAERMRANVEQRRQLRSPGLQESRREEQARRGSSLHPHGKSKISVVYVPQMQIGSKVLKAVPK